ncbi:hypothetical protein BGZ65_002695 [Modicella reniformis]|uniref:Uncharacterized protein n=1 Tax=Modicella reniformis TaxID=1440133 RepID=A0A9P6MIM5_9FUNG|nr:hypothetical protein BGZ65_002695 [Modicella reniformis]
MFSTPHLYSTVDARAIAERSLHLEPHTPYVDPNQGLQTSRHWTRSSSSGDLFSGGVEGDGEAEDEAEDDYYWQDVVDGDNDVTGHGGQERRHTGADEDHYSIVIEPQYHTHDLFDDKYNDENTGEEDEGEDRFYGGGGMITRFREGIKDAFGEEQGGSDDDEDEEDVIDMEGDGNDIDDEGDYVGPWYGHRSSSRSPRRRHGLGLTLRGSTGGTNHGRQSWVINEHDWEDLDNVRSLEDLVDRVEDIEHGRSARAHHHRQQHGGETAFRRLFPQKKWPF